MLKLLTDTFEGIGAWAWENPYLFTLLMLVALSFINNILSVIVRSWVRLRYTTFQVTGVVDETEDDNDPEMAEEELELAEAERGAQERVQRLDAIMQGGLPPGRLMSLYGGDRHAQPPSQPPSHPRSNKAESKAPPKARTIWERLNE